MKTLGGPQEVGRLACEFKYQSYQRRPSKQFHIDKYLRFYKPEDFVGVLHAYTVKIYKNKLDLTYELRYLLYMSIFFIVTRFMIFGESDSSCILEAFAAWINKFCLRAD